MMVSHTPCRIPLPLRNLSLEGLICSQPDATKPCIVVSHGAPRRVADRRLMHPRGYQAPADWFAAQGHPVIIVMRRGYGDSDGDWVESYGTCETADFYTAGLISADDIAAAVTYMQQRGHQRFILAGSSAGGWGSLALASRAPEWLLAVLNFAGGRGSLHLDQNCHPEGLVTTAAAYGEGVKVPSLWLYSLNDRSFAPPLARRMFNAFQRTCAAPCQFRALTAWRDNGHRTFNDPAMLHLWTVHVAAFLANLNNQRSTSRDS